MAGPPHAGDLRSGDPQPGTLQPGALPAQDPDRRAVAAFAGDHAGNRPFPIPLHAAIAHVDRVFGVDRVLALEGAEIVARYYRQSGPGYRRVHSEAGAMHIALNPDGRFDRRGYYAQTDAVAHQIAATGAKRVLELGSGTGFNSLHLAAAQGSVAFTGLDLMGHHVRRSSRAARALGNLNFIQGSYAALPAGLDGQDVVFGVETLCYARNLDTVAREIARTLAPGGRFVMFDGFRRPDFDHAPADVITAARLFEITTAVTAGFWRQSDWTTALERAGLRVLRADDLTADAIACMRRLQRPALRFFADWRLRMLRHLLPRYLVLNAVAGLMGPYMIEGATPAAGTPRGALLYGLILAEKPH
ncbi:MAG: class I SAM-dependent methyltransferase [Rhodobacteraceae bacterium]|nr:class I SAM-dependent methyltransferase [Paracoccaceae bacterium]